MKRSQIHNGPMVGVIMDCGTCETAPTIEIIQPKVVDVSLTLTEKAIEMLNDAFGDDRSHALLVGVLSGGCSGYMYDLQIVESTDIDCQELEVSGFKCSFQTLHRIFSMELKWIMSIVSWVVDSKSTIRTLQVLVVAANPLLEEQPWASSNLMHTFCSFRVKIDSRS